MTAFNRLFCILLVSLACCNSLTAGTEVKWKNVKDPILGSALFHLYQDKNFSGIIQLTADQHLGKIKLQKTEAEQALTMLNLAYGLHREAASSLIAQQKRGSVNRDISNNIWFYIAKIRYQRGYFSMAESSLSQISGALPWELEQDLQLFMALLLMDRGKFSTAGKVLNQIKGNKGAVPFARFNSSASLIKQERIEDAMAMLLRVADMQFKSNEEKFLRDRANLYLGYYHLLEKEDANKAIEHFEKVHLYGLESNEALLGLGWAHYTIEEDERALIAWEELATRNASDPNVQEAMIAVPFTLAKNENYINAGKLYGRALRAFQNEIQSIDDTIISVKKGAFFDKLLTDVSEGEKGWNGDVYDLPKSAESYYFTQMLARHDYQEALKNYRDLRYLQTQIERWEYNLDTYLDTNQFWVKNLLKEAKKFKHDKFQASIDQRHTLRTQYMAQLAEIEANHDAMALATSEEQRHLARVVELKASLEIGASNNPMAQQQRRQLSLIERRIIWDVHSKFDSRLRKVKLDLVEVVKILQQSEERKVALKIMANTAVDNAKIFDARMANTQQKIQMLKPRISSAIEDTEAHLINIAEMALLQRRQKLNEFIAQVSFSVGVSYDRDQ